MAPDPDHPEFMFRVRLAEDEEIGIESPVPFHVQIKHLSAKKEGLLERGLGDVFHNEGFS